MSAPIFKATTPEQLTDAESPERLREIIRHLEQAIGSFGVRVEISMDMPRPRIVVTASSAAGEQRIAEQLAPYIVQAINDTFGELVKVIARAQEPKGASDEPV